MFQHIRKIDIEIHSYCNRTCGWCPNKKFKRNDDDKIMSDELYTKIIDELNENHFGYQKDPYTTPLTRKESHSIFGFLGNQEAFTDTELFKRRVKEAYDKFPTNVRLIANSNGDFITKDSLDNLMLTTLQIMDYDNKGLEYWINKFNEWQALLINADYSNEILTGVHRYIGNIRVICNWAKNWELEDKGGFFKQGDLPNMKWKNNLEPRKMICYDPSINLTIAYDGSVMPCCHMRPDNPDHEDFIMGNVNNSSLKEIYMSSKFVNFRKTMLTPNAEYPSPCSHCQKSRPENYYHNSLANELLARMK